MNPRHVRIFLITLFLIAFILRLYPLQQWHEWDESVYLQHAERIVSGKSNFDELSFRPPVLPILIAGAYTIWHHHYAAEILIALLTSLAVFGLYLLCERIHSSEAGLFAAAIYAFHPLFVRFGHLIFTDALVGTFLIFSMYFLFSRTWWSALAAGALAGIMALTKFSGFGMLPFMAFFLAYLEWERAPLKRKTERTLRALARRGASASRRVILFVAATSAVVMPYLIWAKMNYGSYFATLSRAEELVDLPVRDHLFYLHPQLFTIPLLIGIIAFLAYIHDHARRTETIPFAIFVAVSSTAILIYLTRIPYKHPRYGLLALALFVAIAGMGYATIIRRWRWKHAAALMVTLIVLLSFTSFLRLTGPPVSGWKYEAIGMAEQVNALNNRTGTALPIYAAADYPFYGYYTNNTVRVVDSPQFLRIYGSLNESGYLIVRKDYTRLPTPAWADEQPQLTKLLEDEFTVLYLYSPPR